jgi:nicotinamide-nucleotide amidase
MTPFEDLFALAESVVTASIAAGLKAATAESCTGGLVAGALTAIPGSSAVLERGFVTYSNAAKAEILGVPKALLDEKGAVSEEVARAMVAGALERSQADIAVSITGVAGPGGGSSGKPVGLVHFAAARRGAETKSVVRRFGDLGRHEVRMASVKEALLLLQELIGPR